ncbi:TadE family protein (plasmid) [Xylanimonas cellulosilytica DSM 15894]|uniref:TadE family protein n=1 Tax=Xylanimonas cellulosilytica (strain DSM 15894 / JCM 12276 / CECT 5975 / KCTC 9989 / LMG 20990 / NBRC 107835 / XIL07) TaxID=446471 RepID=D1C0V8_XYLCX|nr:TadE family protein [Xylanimonas cellulosilytica]ACZ32424.1 TadE family protein [Xylanimonas cellulosilytica DSM 15894]
MRRLRERLARDPERGSASAWAAVTTIAMFLFVGIAVDFGGQLHAQQQARDVATQAARAGGQQINAPQAIRGQGVTAQPGDAYSAAASYLAGSGVSGSVQVAGARVIVDTSATYNTKFLSIIGINTLPATGHAEARIARAVGGVEQ